MRNATITRRLVLAAAVLGLVLAVGRAEAGIIYDEVINGESPPNYPGFDLGILPIGTNTVLGSLPGGNDNDTFSFTVAAGTRLDGLILADFVGTSGSFQFSPQPNPFNAPAIGSGDIGSNLLDLVSVASPLGPGTYSFQVRTGINVNPTYAVDLVVSPVPDVSAVPEPSTLLISSILFGMFGVVWSYKRMKQTAVA